MVGLGELHKITPEIEKRQSTQLRLDSVYLVIIISLGSHVHLLVLADVARK